VIVQLLERTCKDVDAYLDLIDAATEILRTVSSKESVQRAIHEEGLVPALLDIIEDAGTTDEGKTEEQKKEDEKKFGETKAAIVEIMVSVTLTGQFQRSWITCVHLQTCVSLRHWNLT